jgi:chemotaxis response regulator CheB
VESLRVFVVEDSTVAAAATRLAIDRDPDWAFVGTAASGTEAIRQCAELHPDVMTLDLNMPDGGGLELLEHIKAHCRVPVVVVSASTYEGSPVIAEALMRGADACFDKRRVLREADMFLRVLRSAADPSFH